MCTIDILTNHVSGITMFFRGLGAVVGPCLVGTIFDLTNSYELACYMAAGCMFLGALFNQISYFVWMKTVTLARMKCQLQ